MTDLMTLDEARRLLATAWDHGVGQGEPQRLLALLDHLAAWVEAGDDLVGVLKRYRRETAHGAMPRGCKDQADAALARWEGLSK